MIGDIRVGWKKIQDAEDNLDKNILSYMEVKYQQEIQSMARSLYNNKIEQLMGKNSDNMPWHEARNIAMQEMGEITEMDFYNEAKKLILPKNTEDPLFYEMLFNLITNNNVLSDEQRLKIKSLITKYLNKIKNKNDYSQTRNIKGATGEDIGIGKLTINLFNEISVILGPNETEPKLLKEHIKDALHQYANAVERGENQVKQSNLTSQGLINEIEDTCKSSLLQRKDFLEELTSYIYGEVIRYEEKSSGDNKNYDIKDSLIYKKTDDKSNTVYEKNYYFDSKSTLVSLGSTERNFIITSDEVIMAILADANYNLNLLNYNNNKRSYDNELLLEYLVKQYGDKRLYYLIDKSAKKAYPLSYLVREDMLYMDPNGLQLNYDLITERAEYQINYGKAVIK